MFNKFIRWPGFRSYLNKLIPKDNLALLVDPGAQMIDNAKPNHRYPALLTGQEQVDNSDFHDFTIDITDGLVAWWQFDSYYHAQEGTGKTILQDLSGNGYDLTAGSGFDYENQMTGDDPTYKNGNALEFDGVDDYAKSSLNPNNSGGSIVVFFSGVSASSKILIGAQNSSGRCYLGLNYGVLAGGIGNDNWSVIKGTTTITQSNNYCGVLTWNNSTVKLYLNGQLEYSGTKNGNTATSTFFIGALNYLGSLNFYSDGFIQSIGIFNRALSATEVKALYGKPKHWTWNETGSISNNNFKAMLSGGAELSQDITVDDETLYKEQKISTTDNDVDYFGNTTSHTITIGDGTWSYAGVKDVTNVSAPNTTVIDYSGNGNDGTAQGGLEANQPVYPYAWEFDGVDDRIDFGTEVGKMGTNPFLITGWFKTTATSGTILSRRQTTDSWYRININSSGKLMIELSYDYGNTTGNVHYEIFSSDIAVNDDIWHFFALVRDNNSDVWLWVDNIKQTATCNFPENLDGFSSDTHLFFGCYRTLTANLFAGKIAPVTIYPFDGQDGRASVMPSNYVDHYIKKIYNNTERYFK